MARTTWAIAVLCVALSGCTRQDQAQIDQDAQKAKVKLQKAGKELQHDLEAAGKKIKDKTRQMEERDRDRDKR